MRGHGTYMKNGTLYASVAGVIQRVNKLISVTPLKTKYQGEIGDVIVGKYNRFINCQEAILNSECTIYFSITLCFSTVCLIFLYTPLIFLEIRVIIKILKNPCYPINVD